VLDAAPHIFGVPIIFNLLAVSIVAAITGILLIGIRESARFNAVMVGIKILVLSFFIIVGLYYVEPTNWKPFAPNGFTGVSAGAAVVFFAYIGFDAVSTVAEETRKPQRDLPIGIIASLVICTIFYVVVAAVFTGMIPFNTLTELVQNKSSDMAEPLPMALAYAGRDKDSTFLHWAKAIVAFGSVVAHTAVLLVYQLGQPRIFMVMARDGLLPPAFARVHPRFRTPFLATILTGVFVAIFAAFANIADMVDLTNIGTLFAFVLVCAGILMLRARDPERPRPFRVPWGPILSTLGILGCLYLVYYLPSTSWLRFAAWLNFGFVIYVGYGVVHSHLTGRQHSDNPAAHDAHTARAGLGLAVLGVLLLVAMQALTLSLKAIEKSGEPDEKLSATEKESWQPEPLTVRIATGLGEVLKPEPWLVLPKQWWLDERFWFLVIPLALNGLVLCPIVIARALRARRNADDPALSRRARDSMVGATALGVMVALYLLVLMLSSGSG
jgi:APA family basic amino acid/polyamine antiporter